MSVRRSNLARHLIRGVTRLELVVTITAAVVLGSLAVPTFNTYLERSRVARAVSDIGTVSLQLHRRQVDTGSLPATLAEAGIRPRDDPWGRPYEYLRVAGANSGRLRKDRNLVPINTDFDLYSRGPDGISGGPLTAQQSRDDIVRAKNGGYIGVAANY
jgi:general secretion pathway protein G